MEALHRKYRPKKLEDFVGNQEVVKSVKSFLKNEEVALPQVIMITGQAGLGKTSLARLIAKEYLCENKQNGRTCGVCNTCQDVEKFIETGRDEGLEVKEVNIASENKKSNIEEILGMIEASTFNLGWRVYIFDEVHMMTTSAQNRMLKTLEEPPEQVLVIMSTTNPEKILDTIKSRCQYNFTLQKPTDFDISTLLTKVAKKESIPIDKQTFSTIIKKTNNVPRRALIELETLYSENPKMEYSKTLEFYNVDDKENYFEFMRLLKRGTTSPIEYISYLGKLKERRSLEFFIESLIEFITEGIYLYGLGSSAEIDESELEKYSDMFKEFSVSDLGDVLSTLVTISSNPNKEENILLMGIKGYSNKTMSKNLLKSVDLIEDFQLLKEDLNDKLRTLEMRENERNIAQKEEEEREKELQDSVTTEYLEEQDISDLIESEVLL